MTDLIARIEKAQPSEARELFEEAWVMISPYRPPLEYTYDRAKPFFTLLDIGTPEALLGAAAMFVPEGFAWEWNGATGRASIWRMPDQFPGGFERLGLSSATTPYFALLAAAMKARQTDERD